MTQITGTAFLFVIGLLLLVGSVEYVSGENNDQYFQYGNNFTGGHWDSYTPGDYPEYGPQDDVPVYVFHIFENNTKVYSTWDEEIVGGVSVRHTIAVLLMISSILIFISILSQLKEGLPDE